MTIAGSFPIVGIGASAGGLAAFEAFFSGMPADVEPGMAFVLVQHLAPANKSLLAELISRSTRMVVLEAEDGLEVRCNHVYTIPPDRDPTLSDGKLHLVSIGAGPVGARHLTVDGFFRSLAQDQGRRAIGIVLAGTGSDGTLGVRAIKEAGGMVLAQDPQGLAFAGMPHNAIATGLADAVLAPEDMAAHLINRFAVGPVAQPPPAAPVDLSDDAAMRGIHEMLRQRTGHDFSQYKPNTLSRRIERRMAAHKSATIAAYVDHARQNPAEVEELFRDLLIGVTGFFRDPEAFRLLEEQGLPELFAGREPGATIRVWSAGCSTGEEAYSVAMLLHERQESLKSGGRIQVFATDIDARAIATARAGQFPGTIAADLAPERLARYFTADREHATCRVVKAIRDLLIFSEQDVIRDPPFSRMDLVCCRNLMIYLGVELQRKLIPMFHYSLRPGGLLFLGGSETIGEFSELFSPIDRRLKIYRRLDDSTGSHPTRQVRGKLPFLAAIGATRPPVLQPLPSKVPMREKTEQALLRHFAPSAALVTSVGDILYLHGRTGAFLEPAPGEATTGNLVKMARNGLRHPLAAALHQAAMSGEAAPRRLLLIQGAAGPLRVALSVSPVPGEPAQFLVVMEALEVETTASATAAAPTAADSSEERLAALHLDLRSKEEFLGSTVAELETANEELKSSNEEMQSVNEALQSTNEELETSQEELQSVNEELATVNAELQSKVSELSRSNNDMNNLLAGSGIGTVFIDHQLKILRFTPAATRIINLIPGDIGRPVGHIVSNLVGYVQLVADAQTVLDTLIPKEVDVETIEGRWYALRIQPYRTLENVIEGAVITFVDITEPKRLRDELRKAQEVLQATAAAKAAEDKT